MSSPPEKKQRSEEYIAQLREMLKQAEEMLEQEKQQRIADGIAAEEKTKQAEEMLEQEKQQRIADGIAAEEKLEQEKQQRIADGIAAAEMLEQQRIAAAEKQKRESVFPLMTFCPVVTAGESASASTTSQLVSVESSVEEKRLDLHGDMDEWKDEFQKVTRGFMVEGLAAHDLHYDNEATLMANFINPILQDARRMVGVLTNVEFTCSYEVKGVLGRPDVVIRKGNAIVSMIEVKRTSCGERDGLRDDEYANRFADRFLDQAGKYVFELDAYGVSHPMVLVTTGTVSVIYGKADKCFPSDAVILNNREVSSPETSHFATPYTAPKYSPAPVAIFGGIRDVALCSEKDSENGVIHGGQGEAAITLFRSQVFVCVPLFRVFVEYLLLLTRVGGGFVRDEHDGTPKGGVDYFCRVVENGKIVPRSVTLRGRLTWKEDALADLAQPGRKLYLWQRLGTGATSEAFLASDEQLHVCAFKAKSQNTVGVSDYDDEVKYWKKVNDMDVYPRSPFGLVMPLVVPFDVSDRRDVLEGGRGVLEGGRGVLEGGSLESALTRLASQGYVYHESDISWRHVGHLVGARDRVVLIDFGSLVPLTQDIDVWVAHAIDTLGKRAVQAD